MAARLMQPWSAGPGLLSGPLLPLRIGVPSHANYAVLDGRQSSTMRCPAMMAMKLELSIVLRASTLACVS